MVELKVGARRKVYCNACKVKTHHELKGVHLRSEAEYEDDGTLHGQLVWWEKVEYRFWICQGCDSATLEEAFTVDGMIGRDGNQMWESTYHPRRIRRDLPKKRFLGLDRKLTSIYDEVIESFNAGLEILCAVGLRALLEGICAEKGVKGSNLEKKIDGLDGFLPSNIVQSLHSFRFMGNVAAHELQAPEQRELRLAIEVMEDLLNFLYELDYKAQRLPQQLSL